MIYSIFSLLSIGDFFKSNWIIILSFKIYGAVFGFLLVLSFCDFKFITLHFLFLKTIKGKGFFNIYLASMFLVGGDSFWSWILFSCFMVCGLFFILIGFWATEAYDESEIKQADLKKKGMKAGTKAAINN